MSLKKLTNITKNQIANKGVQALANRPNAAQQYGVAGLSPTDLKLWFDKLATFLADKINEVQNAISADDAASYIRIALDQYDVASLGDLVKSMQDGSFAQNILQIIPPNRTEQVSLSYFLTDLCQNLSKAVEDISNLQKDKLNKVVEKADTPRVYVVDENGDQKMIPVTKSPGSTGEIPAYDDGKLSASTPENAKHVVNKEYFEKILQSYVSGSVYNEGVKELTQQIKTVNDNLQSEIDKIDNELGIVQTPGDSKYSAMSQWATTNAINRISKRVDNIASFGVIDPYETDDSVAYAKIVPEGALPYAKVAKIGGMSYRDAEAGVLKNAAVTSVKTTGRNLLKFSKAAAVTRNGITFTKNDDGSVSVTGTATNTANFAVGKMKTLLFPTGEYYVSIGSSTTKVYVDAYSGGAWKKTLRWNNGVFSIDSTAYDEIEVCLSVDKATEVNESVFPMINFGSVAQPFEPYREYTFPIPAEEQALDRYGFGLNESVYNYIDFEKKQFVKRVARVDMGTLPASQIQDGVFYVMVDDKASGGNIIADGYSTIDGSYIDAPDKTISYNSTIDNLVYISDSDYKSIYELIEGLAGKKLYYELAEPIVTDISDLLSDDNFIEVSEGGLVIAENAEGLDAPTTIVYQTEGITSMFPDGDEVSY